MPRLGFAADDLQPLSYNNPGLVVDLGVGLWAWPMPMDYDGDGDLDLLVACPDSPSNGVYFFENPGDDPKDPMPVFRSGVRLAAAMQNMQLSQRSGRPVVLVPGREIAWDGQRFAWDKPQPIAADIKANIHDAPVRANMWRYADVDGDSLEDLVIGVGDWTDYGWDDAYDRDGQWRNGPLHGYVYWMPNTGSAHRPQYAAARRLQAAGAAIDVYGWPSPCIGDFDGDGDADLICGEFLDGLTFFENLGETTDGSGTDSTDPREPNYAGGRRLTDASGDEVRMHLQMITPTSIDWDGDGDLDLIVGDEDGRVAWVEHLGNSPEQVPVFSQPRYFQQVASTLKFGALSTPTLADFDDDGDLDLISGNTAGELAMFENQGKAEGGLPIWGAPQLIEASTSLDSPPQPLRIMAGESGSIQGPAEAKWGYTVPSAADWDGDDDIDLVFNSILGEIRLLRRESDRWILTDLQTTAEMPPAWDWRRFASPRFLSQWRTTPCAIDWDDDGAMDLVMLDQEGYLTLRRGGGPAERIFQDVDGQPLQLADRTAGRSGRVKLAVCDWDGDGDRDVIVNGDNAKLLRNDSSDENGGVKLIDCGELAARKISGHTTAPAVADLDGNGRMDLVIGSEDGRFYFIAHENCRSGQAAAKGAEDSHAAAVNERVRIVKEEFIFDRPPTPECHASTIAKTDRGLVAAWFAGTEEGDNDVEIWSAYDDGAGWSKPVSVADGRQTESVRHPAWNPVLFSETPSSPLMLFYKVGPKPDNWWGMRATSYDRGRTFRDHTALPESILGPVRNKPVLVGDRLICGSSTEHDGWRVHFEEVALEDGLPDGLWRQTSPPGQGEFDAIQPTILTRPNGELLALCRSRQGVIVSTRSTDGGKSWSPLEATDLPNPNSAIDAVQLPDGRCVLVYNATAGKQDGGRGRLNVAISEDGNRWASVVELENEPRAEFSYPAVICTDDGLLHIVYTWKRQRIKHVVLAVL